MSTLWTFGDSFTEKYNPKYEWADKYIKWKGYNPKVYGEIISDRLGIHYRNEGVGGSSNYDIFESICKSVNYIKNDDIIIVGWANLVRFRLVNTMEPISWESIQPNYKNKNNSFNISENTVNEILINRSNRELYRQEIENWMKLLKFTFKNNTILFWSWSSGDWGLPSFDYEDIKYETNGKINDNHWSEIGHLQFSDWVIPKLNDNNYINTLVKFI